MRTLLLLLVSRSHARLWSRSVAIANAAGPTGVAALGLLRGIRNGDDAPNLRVCALCRDGEEAILCRRAVCGSVVKEGIVRDMCERSFPSLSVSADLGSSEGEIAAVLRGYTTLVVLMDDIHPSLVEATARDTVVSVPEPRLTERVFGESVRVIDAAAAAGVQHVILHSSLAPVDSALARARMGGEAHLSLRRRLEQHLEEQSQPLRHTILQTAPFASPAQVAERRRECEVSSGGEGEGGGVAAVIAPPPLTSHGSLALAAVQAALYSHPTHGGRRVTREVVSAGGASSAPRS